MQQYWGEKQDPGKLFWAQLNSEGQSELPRETHGVCQSAWEKLL